MRHVGARLHSFEQFPLSLLSLWEAAVSGVAQVVNSRSGAPYDKHLRLRRSLLTHVPTICQVRLAVVHAVAPLVGHTISFLSFSRPSFAGSLAERASVGASK